MSTYIQVLIGKKKENWWNNTTYIVFNFLISIFFQIQY